MNVYLAKFMTYAQSVENGHPFRWWKADSDSGIKRTPIPGQNGRMRPTNHIPNLA
ncbi:hypothetical protein [Salinimicrobium marinum]|uniref:hypothetical protein n=1 Tax=Salinimicrobium marinum TaxID=680283 RepID=UPI001674B143|nr:hypothetical protein [Salinimicrobium marinum]